MKDLKISVSNLKLKVSFSSRNYVVTAFTSATRLKNASDSLRLECKTKQPLMNYRMKQKMTYNFKNNSQGVPHLMFCFDFESLIKPVASCVNASDGIFIKISDKHGPAGFCSVVIVHNIPEPKFFNLGRS